MMKPLVILLLMFGPSVAGLAQESLTMEKAVGLALERNHMLLAAQSDLEAAEWGQRNAITGFLPRAEIVSGYTRIDPETDRQANAAIDFIKSSADVLGIPPSALENIKPFAYRNSYSTNLIVVQPIYNGGAEVVGVSAADALHDRTMFSYEDTEQDVIARTRASYLGVLKAEELLALAKESAGRTRQWLEMTKRREALGSRTQTDVLRFEVELASDEGVIVNAENQLALARLRLNEVMGVDLAARFILEKALLPDTASAAQRGSPVYYASLAASPQTDSEDLSISQHPSLRMMEANVRLAEVNIDREWVNFKPRVNLAFRYGWETNSTWDLDGIRPWSLSLSFSFPIFSGFGDYTNLQKSKAEFRRAGEQLETFRRGLMLQAENAGHNLQAARKRIDIAHVALQQADDVLNSVVRRYDLGAASNLDLIDAQTAYTSARTNYIAAVYDHSISQVELARATGTIVP